MERKYKHVSHRKVPTRSAHVNT
uniref:Uncharacterized protein n=1 Tax=Anguilla anguilla TaxID=7936 RepID=A0A0E9XY44_ANGAN